MDREHRAEAQQRSYMRLPGVVGETAGAPIYAYGRTFVYGAPPDFETNVKLQQGTQSPQMKLRPKKSWEIGENYCGAMVSYQPRVPQSDFQPFLAINLLDGDPQTSWCSRGEAQPDVAAAWVRVDLPAEEKLSRILLTPRKDGHPWPRELVVRLSRDGWHWTAVYDSRGVAPPAGQPVRVDLQEPTPAKQIWVVGNQLTLDSVTNDHTFSFAEVQALDEKGENVALASRGAGVTVSSTNYGWGSAWDYCDLMWPVHYDLGAKWLRLSGGNGPNDYDTLQWRFVEQEKGRYFLDEKTELAMREAAANGYKIMVILCYGNWLYTAEPDKGILTAQAFPTPALPAPITREAFDGFKNWTRFMVERLKSCVAYWEIYNEPGAFGWGVIEDHAERVRLYCDLVEEVVPVIREADPDAKISLGGMYDFPGSREDGGDWYRDCMEHGIGPLIDAIGWHIQCEIHPGLPRWEEYPRAVRELKRDVEAKGFRGVYMASEWWVGAPYPPHPSWGYPPHVGKAHFGELYMTEIRKAKDLARVYLLNLGLSVIPFYCNTWFDTPQNDTGLFRNTFAADPLSPAQPEAGYYVLRNICTIMDGAEPTELALSFSNKDRKFDNWSFRLPDGSLLVALWLPGPSVDKHPGVTTDVLIRAGGCKRVTGIDTLNGFEQELRFEQRGDKVVVPGVVVRDSPLLVRVEPC